MAVARAEDRVEGTTRVGRQLITGHDSTSRSLCIGLQHREDEGTMEVDPIKSFFAARSRPTTRSDT